MLVDECMLGCNVDCSNDDFASIADEQNMEAAGRAHEDVGHSLEDKTSCGLWDLGLKNAILKGRESD